ncbi:MAG: hypothetical protein AABY15_03905 [Nanoarchaeota archaeon]
MFCIECGSKLILKKHGPQIDRYRLLYSSKTGKMFFHIKFACPNKRWWNEHAACWETYLYEKEYKKRVQSAGIGKNAD